MSFILPPLSPSLYFLFSRPPLEKDVRLLASEVFRCSFLSKLARAKLLAEGGGDFQDISCQSARDVWQEMKEKHVLFI